MKFAADGDDDGPKWKYKQASKWTVHELQQWLKSLKLKPANERKVNEAMTEIGCTGEDFVGCRDGKEVAQSLDVSQELGDYLFKQVTEYNKTGSSD